MICQNFPQKTTTSTDLKMPTEPPHPELKRNRNQLYSYVLTRNHCFHCEKYFLLKNDFEFFTRFSLCNIFSMKSPRDPRETPGDRQATPGDSSLFAPKRVSDNIVLAPPKVRAAEISISTGFPPGITRGRPFTPGKPPGFHPPDLRIR